MAGFLKILSCPASEVGKVSSTSSRFNLFHSCYRLGWNPGKSLLESYQSPSGLEFHSLYGYDQELIVCVSLSIPDEAESTEVKEFVRLALREEMKADIAKSMMFLVCESKNLSLVTKIAGNELEGVLELAPTRYFDHNLFIAPSTPLPDITLPEGYFVAPLNEEHVEFMVKFWVKDLGLDVVTEHHRNIMRSNVSSQRPCTGIFMHERPEKPVAWCLCYIQGSIGSLHVLEEHRGMKLARSLIRYMSRKVLESHGIPTSVCVHFDNSLSAKLFTSEGWEKQTVNCQKMFVNRRDYLNQ